MLRTKAVAHLWRRRMESCWLFLGLSPCPSCRPSSAPSEICVQFPNMHQTTRFDTRAAFLPCAISGPRTAHRPIKPNLLTRLAKCDVERAFGNAGNILCLIYTYLTSYPRVHNQCMFFDIFVGRFCISVGFCIARPQCKMQEPPKVKI